MKNISILESIAKLPMGHSSFLQKKPEGKEIDSLANDEDEEEKKIA